MSETKTKNLCTVPAADLTDSQYFIAEDGGELKRIPKAQVVLKKLEKMLATDTENLAGGGEVTAQELLDALAEQVANKLLAKSQVVNNLLATVEGNPLDATQGKALKDLIDTTNNNLSNVQQSITQLNGYKVSYYGVFDKTLEELYNLSKTNTTCYIGFIDWRQSEITISKGTIIWFACNWVVFAISGSGLYVLDGSTMAWKKTS